jgi:hypothetical protein
VKELVPVDVGVPDKIPVVVLREIPAGKEPD